MSQTYTPLTAEELDALDAVPIPDAISARCAESRALEARIWRAIRDPLALADPRLYAECLEACVALWDPQLERFVRSAHYRASALAGAQEVAP